MNMNMNMNMEIIAGMEKRIGELDQAIKEARNEEGEFPEGRLKILSTVYGTNYYHVAEGGETEMHYISRADSDLIAGLAQKKYNQKFLKAAQAEQERLKKTVSWLARNNADNVYEKLTPQRQELVSPYIMSNREIAQKWQSEPFEASTYKPEKKIYETRRGEMVRSKGEAILADILLELGIPYRYEQLVYLKGDIVKAPDFTMLDVPRRGIIYMEHFGMLEDKKYLLRNLIKLDLYRRNGIYTGKNLIVTHEAEGAPMDIQGIRRMLEEAFQGGGWLL